MEGMMMVEALLNGNREAKIRAANALTELPSRQRHILVECGVIAPLVSMLNSQEFGTTEAALFALLSLAFGSERNKIIIAKSGAIPMIAKLLQHQTEDMIEPAVAALLILSSCTKTKLAIAASGAVEPLVYMLNTPNNSIAMQAKLDSIATLHNLSISEQIIPLIVSSGVILSLLQLVYDVSKSSKLVEKALGLLENIASSSNLGLQEIAETGGAIRTLVEALEEGSSQCREYAVAILFLVCRSCREKYRGQILREGVMPGLLQVSIDGTWRAKEMARGLLQLLRDESDCGSRRKQLKNVILEQIMKEIDAKEESTEGEALRLVEDIIAKLKA
ncbi:Armadillo [Dillenia turbinata]|uniref:Armadillo n=1 Tax=Dillenia turbinata TaxID=194707 RepID=A0AAN8YUM4_9MAGN